MQKVVNRETTFYLRNACQFVWTLKISVRLYGLKDLKVGETYKNQGDWLKT